MACVDKEEFLDFHGWHYAVVTQYSTGHKILCNVKSIFPWCILNPDGSILRFKSEQELWQYAIENKLFKKKRKDKEKWGFQS